MSRRPEALDRFAGSSYQTCHFCNIKSTIYKRGALQDSFPNGFVSPYSSRAILLHPPTRVLRHTSSLAPLLDLPFRQRSVDFPRFPTATGSYYHRVQLPVEWLLLFHSNLQNPAHSWKYVPQFG